MSDQPTRAREPEADPRQPFTLSTQDAIALHAAADPTGRSRDDTQAALNAWWLEAGTRLGFVWTTVADLTWQAGSDKAHVANPAGIVSATFTAWPIVKAWEPDPDAVAWLANMVVEGDADALKNRELILRAWAAGRDTGFAMGSVAPSSARVVGWDGMELIRECAELLRFYEANHLAKVPAWRAIVKAGVSLESVASAEAAIADTTAKAERNAAQAAKLEAFLADPTQSHLVHDAIREAREDNATAALAGWHAAMLQVRELVESGRAQAGSGIPPLVLLDRLEELPPPEDMDEVFQRLRNPLAQVEALRVALREWFDKTEWVREMVKADVPKRLGMPSQLGRHCADTARDLAKRLNDLLADALADRLIGLRVQAAADVLQAMGIGPGASRTRSARAVDLGGTSTRYPIAEGLERMGQPCVGCSALEVDPNCPAHGEKR